MKKIFLLLSILSASIYFGSCQSVEKKILKLDFFLPGMTFEKGISQKSSFVVNPMLGFNFGWSRNGNYFDLIPNLNLEYRYYYNLKRRLDLKKRTANNTGNFIAAKTIMRFPSISSDDNSKFAVGIGGVYGIQRTYASGIYILGESGIGIGGSKLEAFPILTFKIGYVIGKHR